MSRCFPYPPPGFDPKLKNDHVDLLHKEKHKEKKHKKEKKDKDKRDGKERREKDKHHSKEKHRDDKEKREKEEKHKHKKREKDRDKEREKEKSRAQPVLAPVPTERTPEDSRILNEHSRRVGEGTPAGPGSQFTERRVPGNTYGASEKRPVSVPVQQPVPSLLGQSNEVVKVRSTSQITNHRVTAFNERRVASLPSCSSPEEGVITKRAVPGAPNPNVTNPNSLMQRKSNGPPNQVMNHHGTGFTERRVAGAEVKKPVPSSLNSLQGKTNGPTSQSTNHHHLPLTGSTQNRGAATERGADAKRASGNSVVLMQRKTDGPALPVTNNHHAAGLTERRVSLNQSLGLASALEKDKEKDKERGGLNMSGSEHGGVKQEERKKEKRKERDEKKEREKELRRQEKKQRKEREKEEKERKKENEARDKVEVGISMTRPSIEAPQRNIEKVGGTDGILSKKRKEGESNGFLHEDDMRAQKLARTSPPYPLKRKDALTNGFLHETDVDPTKLTKRLPTYPPPLENGSTSHHPPPPFLPPPVKPISNSPSTTAANNTPAYNSTIKAESSLIKKPPQLNGTIPVVKVHKKRKEEPPHPDLKYLNVVYSVPKLEEKELMPPFDDQEWLFGTKPNRNLEPNSKILESGLSDGTDQVWDRAVRLDSDGAFALPYVVPF